MPLDSLARAWGTAFLSCQSAQTSEVLQTSEVYSYQPASRVDSDRAPRDNARALPLRLVNKLHPAKRLVPENHLALHLESATARTTGRAADFQSALKAFW